MMRWKWAATNMVSCRCTSGPACASHTPESPPLMNSEITPMAQSMGVVKRMRDRHRVASQLKTLIAEGTAMRMVPTAKAMPR
jgi:hypothetical protein